MKNVFLPKMLKDIDTVGFFGLGKSNQAVMRLLPKDVRVILRSEGTVKKEDIPRGIKPIAIYEGADAFRHFDEQILFLSPSVRRERAEFDEARLRGVQFSSDFELFLSENSSPLFAISGSDGKSTTASLTAMLLSGGRRKFAPMGNIGLPFCRSLPNRADRITVAELSSFQLRYTSPRAKRAVVTNITPNHLNWHADFEEYKNTKISLLDGAEEKVIFADDSHLFEYSRGKSLFGAVSVKMNYKELKERLTSANYFTIQDGYLAKNGDKLLPLSHVRLVGEHNVKNLLTAIAMTDGYATREKIVEVAAGFGGLSHRCELIGEFCGIKFINSSIDTTPSRTETTLNSLGENLIVILGGRSKGCDYTNLKNSLSAHAKLAIITGENREEIKSDIKGGVDIAVTDDFEEAIIYAASVAKAGDTVLLSPASVSYDSFKSFEERGEKFKEIIFDFYKNR